MYRSDGLSGSVDAEYSCVPVPTSAGQGWWIKQSRLDYSSSSKFATGNIINPPTGEGIWRGVKAFRRSADVAKGRSVPPYSSDEESETKI